eukprot:gene8417-11384_t
MRRKSGQLDLLEYARSGNLYEVLRLLEDGVPVDSLSTIGRSALHWAAVYDHESIVSTLIKDNANLNFQDHNGKTALYGAVRNKNYSMVSKLLDVGANPNIPVKNGYYALLLAVNEGDESLVEMLVNGGADMNIPLRNGVTALTEANRLGNEKILKKLLEQNVKVKGNESIDASIEEIETNVKVKGNESIGASIEEIEAVIRNGYKKWNRSKICLVGEGRVGKTATANTIIGSKFVSPDSTVGINEITCDVKLTCNVKHAYASNDIEQIMWVETNKTEKENRRYERFLYIKFWLNSIAIHTQYVKDGETFTAPIVLIGTHKDEVSKEENHYNISELLRYSFGYHTAWKYVRENKVEGKDDLCFFPINNKLGRDDLTVQSLLKTINDIMAESDYIQKEVPLTWLEVVDKFSEHAKTKPWLSYDEAVYIGSDCGIHCKKIHPSDMDKMVGTGVVSSKLMDELLFDKSKSNNISNQVIKLMIKYGLIVPFSYANNNDKVDYLVPSIIPSMIRMSDGHDENWTKKHTKVGYFVFATDLELSKKEIISKSELQRIGFLPKGLFERLSEVQNAIIP